MKAPLRFERMFQSLNHPNYRLFFVGQGLSLPGNSMQILAEAWLTYRVTGSPLAVGRRLVLLRSCQSFPFHSSVVA